MISLVMTVVAALIVGLLSGWFSTLFRTRFQKKNAFLRQGSLGFLLGFLVNFCFYYFFMPAMVGWNWIFAALGCLAAPLILTEAILDLAVALDMTKIVEGGWVKEEDAPSNGMLRLIVSAVLSAIVLGVFSLVTFIPHAFTTWGDSNVAYYASLANVSKSDADMPKTDVTHIVMIPQSVAYYQGQQSIGSNGNNLGSQFYTDQKDYVLQSVKHHLYWVAQMRYNNVLVQWSTPNLPGYVSVDAEDPNARAVLHTDTPLHYTDGAYFNQDITRYLYFKGYSNVRLIDPTLEVDDNWKPFYTVTVESPTGPTQEDVPVKFLVVDSLTGDIQEYKIGETPAWCDRVISESTAKDLLTQYAQYGVNSAWFNPTGDRKSKLNGDIDILYNDVDSPVWLASLTSDSNKDNASTGFVLYNTQKREGTFYQNPLVKTSDGKYQRSSINLSVDDIFKSNPNNIKKYNVEYVQLYVLYGRLTWVGIFTNSLNIGSSFQGIGFLDALAPNGSNVVMAQTLSAGLQGYQNYLAGVGNTSATDKGTQTKTETKTVVRVNSQVQNNTTVYYFVFAHDPKTYTAPYTLSNDLPTTQSGDQVEISYLDTQQATVPILSFKNKSLEEVRK